MQFKFVDSQNDTLEYTIPDDPTLKVHIRLEIEQKAIMGQPILRQDGKAITHTTSEQDKVLNEIEAHAKEFLTKKYGAAITDYENRKRK